MTAALIIVALLVGMYVVAGAVVFNETIKRPDHNDRNYDPSLDPAAFEPTGHTPFRINSHEGNIWWNSQPLERLEQRSFDGLALVGHLLRAKEPSSKLAFLVHGHLCVSGEMGFIARMYYLRGYNVFIADQRAHGKSEGEYIGMGHPESRDMLAWLPIVAQALGGEIEAVLHGISMGAATVMLMAGSPELPEYVKCAVEDCGYADAFGAISNVANKRLRWQPLYYANIPTRIASLINKLKFGFGFRDESALAAVKRARVPIMFIHGDADPTVPYEMAHELYDACSSEKKLETFRGAAHGVSYFAAKARYESSVFRFVERYIH